MPIATEQIPFLTHFAKVADPRIHRTRRHALPDILFVSVCAILCGANDCLSIALFCRSRLTWLRKFVPLLGGAPSHDTFSRVFRLINASEFEKVFIEWVNQIRFNTMGEVVAIDGKVMRGSFDKASGKAAIDIVSAWGSANGLVLGQVKTNEKSNEITAIPILLKMLDLQGCIVTIDAIGTQKSIAKQICEQKADYILPVKNNQPNLSADLQAAFERWEGNRWMDANANPIAHSFHQTVDADHGRIETRSCLCTEYLDGITEAQNWHGLKTIIKIQRKRDNENVYIRYFITSLRADAQTILGAVRAHWGIENSLHWVLDVNFREDYSRTRKDNGAQIRAMLNRVANNICKSNTTEKMAISQKRHRAAWDENFLEQIITNRII